MRRQDPMARIEREEIRQRIDSIRLELRVLGLFAMLNAIVIFLAACYCVVFK